MRLQVKGFHANLKDKQNQVSRDKGISFKGFLKGGFFRCHHYSYWDIFRD